MTRNLFCLALLSLLQSCGFRRIRHAVNRPRPTPHNTLGLWVVLVDANGVESYATVTRGLEVIQGNGLELASLSLTPYPRVPRTLIRNPDGTYQYTEASGGGVYRNGRLQRPGHDYTFDYTYGNGTLFPVQTATSPGWASTDEIWAY